MSVYASGSAAAEGAFDLLQVEACQANEGGCLAQDCPRDDAAACVLQPMTEGSTYSVTAVLRRSGKTVSLRSVAMSVIPLHP